MLDLRFLAARKLLATTAILTMALALGANTAALSVLKALLLSSLGLPEAERVVVVSPERNLPGRGSVQFSEAYPNYQLLRKVQHSFSDVTALVQSSASWNDDGETRQLAAARVTASFFSTMRVQPMLGRGFLEKEEGPSPAAVVVVSHGLWTSALGGDKGVVGKTLSINGSPHTVIGVMPPRFAQPVPTDLWLPFDIPPNQRTQITGARQLTVFGRLAPNKSLDAAKRDMVDFTARAVEMSAPDNKDYRYNLIRLRDNLLNGADSSALFVLAGAAALLLLAIFNLASLLIAWGVQRRQEVAVRFALGASHGHVVRLLLQQSVVIVVAGAAAGVVLAFVTLRVLQRFDLGPTVTPFIATAHLDLGILAATAFIAISAGLVAGTMPALLTRDTDLGDVLRSSSRSATLSPRALGWQKAMVVAQTALSVVILAAAGLTGASFWRLSSVPSGFTARGKVVARLALPDARYDNHGRRAAFGRALAEHLANEPQLVKSGFTSTLPVSDQTSGNRFLIELPDGSVAKEPALFHIRRVSPGYLGSIGIPVMRGRSFTPQDDSGAVLVAIVSRALAERLWPNEDGVGKRLIRPAVGNGTPTPLMIVGVVGNTMDAGYGSPAGETVYVPYSQISSPRLSIVAEGRGDVASTVAAIRHAVKLADPTIAAGTVATLDDLVLQANALPRLRALVLLVFAVVAASIVSLGSYGVMSQLVSNRERELAVRLVFGARPGQLGSSVLAQAARLTVPGIIVGLAAIWSLGGALKSFVFGIEPTSLPVLASAGLALLAIALLATMPSALRAMRVDIRRGIGAG